MTRIPQIGLAILLAALVGCPGDSSSPTAPTRESGPSTSLFSSPALIACPSATTQTNSGLIGPLGGVLSAGGVVVTIPAGALLAPTQFTLTVPASQYLEIDVKADGADHYVFQREVAVAIDYGRCGVPPLHAPLTAWNIDPDTKALLEQMPTVDAQLTHTVIFSTIHFSGYAVAD